MEMIDEKDNGVITNYYKDLSTGRPIVKIKTEKQTVNSLKNVIQLIETPDEQERVTIVDSTNMVEVDNYEDLTEENQYWVDYKNPLGNIYFHPSKKAQTYNIKYGSKGYTLISANKIFTKLDEDGNVVEVLSDILEQGRDIIDELLILGGGVQVFYKLQQSIADGTELNTSLENNINEGTPLDQSLKNNIKEAKTFIDELDANVKKGQPLNESLKVQNPKAEQNLANLNQAMVDCADDIANITKTDNGVAIVTTENWGNVDSEGFYHCTVTHTANSKDLNLDIFDYTNNVQGESVFVTVTPLTNTTFKVSSIENTPIKIVFASGYYGGYTSANTRDAINSLENEKQNKIDNLLETTNKSIPLAINEVKSSLEETTKNFKSDGNNETAPLGSELVSPNGWISDGWTGDFSSGFTHTTGNTNALEYPLNAIANKLYQISMIVEDTDTMNSGFKFTCTIGNSEPFEMYKGTGSVITYEKGIKAVENGSFKIIPKSDFTGTIKNISIKEIIGIVKATFEIKNSQKQNVFEIRPSKLDLNNIFEGKNVGRYNTCGYENVIIGDNAFENNVSGFWNSALGYQALQNNINGSRNIALGYNSLSSNISGHRNIGVGTFSLHRVTTGAYNIGIGADSAWHTTTGSYNIAIGTVSLDNNTSGNQNIAIGYNALRDVTTQSNNVAIGHWSLRENTAQSNTAIGSLTLTKNTIGTGQTAIGYKSLNILSNGNANTAIGESTLSLLVNGSGNTGVGRACMLSLTEGHYNTVIGNDSAKKLTTGRDNTIIGQNNALSLVSGDGNILIGRNIDVPNADTSKFLNIGNVIFSDMTNGRVGLGLGMTNPLARLHLGGGTSEVPPIRINGGTLLTTPMKGAIESDGSYLYFTNSAGTRLKIQATPA